MMRTKRTLKDRLILPATVAASLVAGAASADDFIRVSLTDNNIGNDVGGGGVTLQHAPGFPQFGHPSTEGRDDLIDSVLSEGSNPPGPHSTWLNMYSQLDSGEKLATDMRQPDSLTDFNLGGFLDSSGDPGTRSFPNADLVVNFDPGVTGPKFDEGFVYKIEGSIPGLYTASGQDWSFSQVLDPTVATRISLPALTGIVKGSANSFLTAKVTKSVPNTPPVVNQGLEAKAATYGDSFGFVIPEDTITDAEGPVSYSVNGLPPGLTYSPGSRLISGNLTDAGNFTSEVVGTDSDGASVTNSFPFNVSRKIAQVDVDPEQGKVYGDVNPPISGSASGFLPGDNISVGFSTTATPESDAGLYDVNADVSDPLGRIDNYTVRFDGEDKFAVDKRPATIVENPVTTKYGDAAVTPTGRIENAVPGDGLEARFETDVTPMTTVGQHPIRSSLEPNPKLVNYEFTTQDADHTVDPADLTVAAMPMQSVYGTEGREDAYDFSITGFRNGEGLEGNVTGKPSLTSPGSDMKAPVGQHPIEVGMGDLQVDPNKYVATGMQDSMLNITPRPAMATIGSDSKVYLQNNPVASVSFQNVLPGDTIPVTVNDSATQTSAPGTYQRTGTAGNPNYQTTVMPANLTVTENMAPSTLRAPTYNDGVASITADTPSRAPTFTATLLGSPNLRDWTPLETRTVLSENKPMKEIGFTDSNPGDYKFYKVETGPTNQ